MAVFEKRAEIVVDSQSVGGDCLEAMLGESCAEHCAMVRAMCATGVPQAFQPEFMPELR